MKNTIFSMLLTTFIIVGFTGQSWAFGSRGHHHSGDGSTGQGSLSSGGNAGNGSSNGSSNGAEFQQFGADTLFSNADGDDHHSGDNDNPGSNNGDADFVADDQLNKEIPTDPVPEPTTIYLLGIGLAGFMLVRVLRQSRV